MADPFDKELSGIVAKAVRSQGVLQGEGVRLHENGTVICIGKYSFMLYAVHLQSPPSNTRK